MENFRLGGVYEIELRLTAYESRMARETLPAKAIRFRRFSNAGSEQAPAADIANY